jgi:hypothetical protein
VTTLAELVVPLTVEEVKASIYDALVASGVKTTSWKPGAVARTIIAGVAIVGAAFSRLQADIANGGYLDSSSGPWLVLLARHVYGVEKDLGSFATGIVEADNAGGGVYSGDAGDLIFTNSTTGKSYRNTASFSIGAAETDVEIAVQAVELGSDSTAAATEIDTLETPLVGVTVSNPTALVGTDPESDDALRLRCRESLGALSPNGPRDAYAFVAKGVLRDDGSSIGVTRVRTVPDGFGNVDVYVASGSGGVTGTVGDLGTDLGLVDDEIQRLVTPLGVTADVQTATALSIPLTYELWIRSDTGLTDTEINDLIEDAHTSSMAVQPIGGTLIEGESTGRIYKQAVETVLGRALPAGSLIDLGVTDPAGDVDVAADEAPVAGTVTPTIHQVTDDLGSI